MWQLYYEIQKLMICGWAKCLNPTGAGKSTKGFQGAPSLQKKRTFLVIIPDGRMVILVIDSEGALAEYEGELFGVHCFSCLAGPLAEYEDELFGKNKCKVILKTMRTARIS